MKVHIATLCAILTMLLSMSAADLRFYVGTYTKKGGSQGIYEFGLNSETGKLTPAGLRAESKNPSFLALHPNGKLLYAVNEIDGSGGVSAFAIEADGNLRPLNQQPSRGAGACHLIVDPQAKNVLVANYNAGNIAVLPIKADGSLTEATGFVQHHGSSVNPQRQKEPHAHSIYTDRAGRLVYVCDLGTDHIDIYKLDAQKGTLAPNDPAFAR
jgi:6-phosphogluconolactonase